MVLFNTTFYMYLFKLNGLQLVLNHVNSPYYSVFMCWLFYTFWKLIVLCLRRHLSVTIYKVVTWSASTCIVVLVLHSFVFFIHDASRNGYVRMFSYMYIVTQTLLLLSVCSECMIYIGFFSRQCIAWLLHLSGIMDLCFTGATFLVGNRYAW